MSHWVQAEPISLGALDVEVLKKEVLERIAAVERLSAAAHEAVLKKVTAIEAEVQQLKDSKRRKRRMFGKAAA